MINYDFQEKINELKSFLERKEVNIIKEAINIDNNNTDNCYCQLRGKHKDKIINIHLKPYDENSLSIFYSYWLIENKHIIQISPVIEYSIMEIPSESKKLEKIFKQSFHTFMEMIKVYSKINKEKK